MTEDSSPRPDFRGKLQVVVTDAAQPFHGRILAGNGEPVWWTENYDGIDSVIRGFTLIGFDGTEYEIADERQAPTTDNEPPEPPPEGFVVPSADNEPVKGTEEEMEAHQVQKYRDPATDAVEPEVTGSEDDPHGNRISAQDTDTADDEEGDPNGTDGPDGR